MEGTFEEPMVSWITAIERQREERQRDKEQRDRETKRREIERQRVERQKDKEKRDRKTKRRERGKVCVCVCVWVGASERDKQIWEIWCRIPYTCLANHII